MDVAAELNKFSGTNEEQYRALIGKVADADDHEWLIAIPKHLIEDAVRNPDTQVIQRPVLDNFIEVLSTLEFSSLVEVGTKVLDMLLPRMAAFEKQVSLLAYTIGTAYFQSGNDPQALVMYRKVKPDAVDEEFEVHLYCRIAQSELRSGNPEQAESWVNKAGKILRSYELKDKKIALKYKFCYAKIRDCNRQFLTAARHFYGLSQSEDMDNKEMPLRSACIAAIVSPAGPLRNSLLNTLYKDERTSHFDSIRYDVYPVLEKMTMGKIVRDSELGEFKQILPEHYRAENADGSTVFSRAIMDHNLYSAATLYSNISFVELGNLLGISAAEAEETASVMISEDRLKGAIIDQVDGYITFKHVEEKLLVLDTRIDLACLHLNRIVETIEARHPQYIET